MTSLPPTTDQQISDLGSLIALALALVTVFTAQRAQALRERRDIPGKTKLRVFQGSVLDLALFAPTAALTAAALPLARAAVDEGDLFSAEGALRTTFAIVCLLLVGLLAWQLSIGWRTLRQARGRPWRGAS